MRLFRSTPVVADRDDLSDSSEPKTRLQNIQRSARWVAHNANCNANANPPSCQPRPAVTSSGAIRRPRSSVRGSARSTSVLTRTTPPHYHHTHLAPYGWKWLQGQMLIRRKIVYGSAWGADRSCCTTVLQVRLTDPVTFECVNARKAMPAAPTKSSPRLQAMAKPTPPPPACHPQARET